MGDVAVPASVGSAGEHVLEAGRLRAPGSGPASGTSSIAGCTADSAPGEIVAFDARYVNDQYHGIGRHAYHLIEALSRLDPGRRYLAYYCPDLPNSRFDLRALGERPNVELRPVDLPLYSPKEQVFWPLELARRGVALFHSPYVALPLLAPGTRLVMTIHDVILERFPEYMPRTALRHFYRLQTALSVRRAACVLTVSHAAAQDILEFYPRAAGKVRVIGGAVDSSFRPVAGAAHLEDVRQRYGLPPQFVLTVGAGRPHKNVALAVEALAQMDPALVPALVIAGDADARFGDLVGERVRALGLHDRIVRAGRIAEEDLPALYCLADALVFPSLVEGFGLPSLEAMACGTPVLASNASSVPEVVGEAALTFDPHDATQLSRLLTRVASDASLRADLVQRGLARAQALNWDRVASATLDVYAAVLDRSAAVARQPA